MMKKILSIKNVAELLSISDESVRNLEKEGKLSPFYTSGGHRRYKIEDIKEFLINTKIKKSFPIKELEELKGNIETMLNTYKKIYV